MAVPHRVFNIGNSQPVELMRLIEMQEQAFGKKAIKQFPTIQPGDLVLTAANTADLKEWVGIRPFILINYGIQRFAGWCLDFLIDQLNRH